MEQSEPTINTTEESDEASQAIATGLDRPMPRLVVLYHSDLSRIGAITAPDAFERGQWVPLGRNAPSFVPLDSTQKAAPLADPRISRFHADIRWIEAQGAFEVVPSSKARKPLTRVTLGDNGGPPYTMEPIETPTLLPPGTLMAIGKRTLLLLDLRAWHAPTDDRMGMAGETELMWKVRAEIESVARFERAVLILGETGAGKELVASAIHAYSPRRDKPFAPVNCAALPEHLVESMLFGHKRGAFTGAAQDQAGVFQDTDGGCLFLDELGELPMGIQAKLLRISQDGMITPVGSNRHKPVDVRIIAATNRDPVHEIQAGNLREDLYYRIAAHTIEVPSLRERRWDVPLLFIKALETLRERHIELNWLWETEGRSRPPIPMSFILSLMRHPWNGNVRELQNIAEQTARLNARPGHFHYPTDLTRRSPSLSDKTRDTLVPPGLLGEALTRKASRELGISRKTLNRLLRARGITPPESAEPFEDFMRRLEKHLSSTLSHLLAQANHSQVQLAAELDLSRSTLIKLILSLKLTRPQDLSLDAIQKASKQTGGDVEAMAALLKVSGRALKLHLSRNDLAHLLDA